MSPAIWIKEYILLLSSFLYTFVKIFSVKFLYAFPSSPVRNICAANFALFLRLFHFRFGKIFQYIPLTALFSLLLIMQLNQYFFPSKYLSVVLNVVRDRQEFQRVPYSMKYFLIIFTIHSWIKLCGRVALDTKYKDIYSLCFSDNQLSTVQEKFGLFIWHDMLWMSAPSEN
jgi:hypothetical protein